MPHKRTPTPEKYCEICRDKLERKSRPHGLESIFHFSIRRYCDRKCQYAAHRAEGANKRKNETSRVCPRCKEDKLLSEFPIRGRNKHNYDPRFGLCRPCDAKRSAKYRLKRFFNVSPTEYLTILAFQGGGCFICGRLEPNRYMPVDHNHKTGMVRGLLCNTCNRLIGAYKESTACFERIVEYLKDPPAPKALGEPRFGVLGPITKHRVSAL